MLEAPSTDLMLGWSIYLAACLFVCLFVKDDCELDLQHGKSIDRLIIESTVQFNWGDVC